MVAEWTGGNIDPEPNLWGYISDCFGNIELTAAKTKFTRIGWVLQCDYENRYVAEDHNSKFYTVMLPGAKRFKTAAEAEQWALDNQFYLNV